MPIAAPTRARCGPRRARSSCSASITGRTTIRWQFCKTARSGGISVYARGDDYHELIKPRLKNLGRWLIDNAGGDIKVFVDTAPVMEKPLAAAAGLGWQGKHTNLVSRQLGSWLFLGAIFTTLDLPPDAPESGSLRQLPRLPRRLPDRRISGAVSARCAALHLLPHHRAQRSDPARTAGADGQSHLWLRRLPRGLSVEQIRGRRPRGETGGARGVARAAACRSGAARRRRVPRPIHQERGQAHRPRALRPQCADRDRQFRRCRARRRGRAVARRCFAAGARRRDLGARPARSRAARSVRRRARTAETDPEVIAEWAAARQR